MRSLYIFLFVLTSLTTFAQVTINRASVKIDSNGIDTMFLNYTSYLGRPYTTSGVYGNSSCNYTSLQWFHFKDSIQPISITIDTAFGIPFGNFQYGIYELKLVWDTVYPRPVPPVPFIILDSFSYNPCSSTNINEIANFYENSIQLYPNPAIDQVNIEISEDISIKEINIYDINGKTVSNIQNINNQIDFFEHTSGLYYVRFFTNKGMITKKIIVTN